jgi:MFS family permease
VSALYLATATGQPVVGRLIDRYGARRLYLAGAALVGVAGVIGALAPSLGYLILSRVLLGLGTCAGYPAAMYLIRRSGVEKPGGLLTALAVSAQTIVVIGPTVGGLLIGAAGWRSLFAVNIPLALVCLVLGAILLPRADGLEEFEHRLDDLGIGLFAGTLTSLMLFLMSPSPGHLWLPALAAARRRLSSGALGTAPPADLQACSQATASSTEAAVATVAGSVGRSISSTGIPRSRAATSLASAPPLSLLTSTSMRCSRSRRSSPSTVNGPRSSSTSRWVGRGGDGGSTERARNQQSSTSSKAARP